MLSTELSYRYYDTKMKQFVFSDEFGYASPLERLEHFFAKAKLYSPYKVERWTGTVDMKGTKIYEGDIVRTLTGKEPAEFHLCNISVDFVEYNMGLIKWLREGFCVCQERIGSNPLGVYVCLGENETYEAGLVVIGNIHE